MSKPGETLVFEGLPNARDLGGYQGEGGKHVVYKRMLRSYSLSRITSHDIQVLKEEYNLKYDIDLRGDKEINPAEDIRIPGVEFISLPIRKDHDGFLPRNPNTPHYDVDERMERTIDYLFKIDPNGICAKAMEPVYRDSVSSQQAISCWRKFFQLVLDTKEGSILFHCASGKDRTGICAMLFLKLLGVSDEDIIYDYLLSDTNFAERKAKRREYLKSHGVDDENLIDSILMLSGVQRNWMEAAIDEIEVHHQGIEHYFEDALGFSKEQIQQLKTTYLR